jgi:hypothetical protein
MVKIMKNFILIPIILIVFSCTSLSPEEEDKQDKLEFIEDIINDPDNFESIYLNSKYKKVKKGNTFIGSKERPIKTIRFIKYIKTHFKKKEFYLEKIEIEGKFPYYKKKYDSNGNQLYCKRQHFFIRNMDSSAKLKFTFGNCSEEGKWDFRRFRCGEYREYIDEYDHGINEW